MGSERCVSLKTVMHRTLDIKFTDYQLFTVSPGMTNQGFFIQLAKQVATFEDGG
jgi:hypothetical protein